MPASAVPWVSAGLGGLGLLSQSSANAAQESDARKAQALQLSEIAQQRAYEEKMMGIAETADQSGEFNPDTQLSNLQHQTDLDRGNALSSEAGAARALGYKPGDTAPLDQMNATRAGLELQQKEMANQIDQQQFARKEAAYGAANPSGLNAGIGALGEDSRFDVSREVPLTGGLSSIEQGLGQFWQQRQGSLLTPGSYGNYVQTGPIGTGENSVDTTQNGWGVGLTPSTPTAPTAPVSPFGGVFSAPGTSGAAPHQAAQPSVGDSVLPPPPAVPASAIPAKRRGSSSLPVPVWNL
jgi:hypothetical protein